MSDSDFNPKAASPGTPKKPRERAAEATNELKQRAGEAVKASTDTARDKAREAADAASQVASDAAEKLQERVQERQRAGADFVQSFAGNIRQAAQAFEKDTPFAAHGINTAADYVEGVAREIRNGSFRDVIGRASDFARRQPTAFLGLSVLAGFAALRLLKISGETQQAGARTTGTTSLPVATEPQPTVAWPAPERPVVPTTPGQMSPARTGNLT